MALGAQRASVYRLVLQEAGWLTAIGIIAGLGMSLVAMTLMSNLLFEVQSWDLSTLGAVAAILAACAMLATFMPAKRAAAVDPTDALRSE
jgi:ABC-type antimicrobial peptide transport system permease subunit